MGQFMSSSRQKNDEFFPSPVEISQNALDSLTHYTDTNYSFVDRLETNEEIWLKRYNLLEQSQKKVDADVETFYALCESLSKYLESSQCRKGETLKNELLHCYFTADQPLKCASLVHKFHEWVNETRHLLGNKNKDSLFEDRL